MDAIGAPGMTLAVAVLTTISQSRRDAVPPIIAALTNAEMLTIFLRAQYASDLAALRDQTRIFRDNSIGMATTGMLLRTNGGVLEPDLTEVLLREADGKPSAILAKCFPILKRMPQMNRIVLREALIATRKNCRR
jgi:hypothetical protein